jgi:hypothetical protein
MNRAPGPFRRLDGRLSKLATSWLLILALTALSGGLACGPSAGTPPDPTPETDRACLAAAGQADGVLRQVNLPPPAWSARWIGPSGSQPNQWSCYRTTFRLGTVPSSVPARLAADTKYWLWVNGQLVVREGGLKRGPTPQGTYFDALDLGPYLHAGPNTLAILQWYFGRDGFSHRDSTRAGLLFEMNAGGAALIRSDSTWKVLVHPAFGTCPPPAPNFRLPESDVLYDARLELAGWTDPGFDDSAWPQALDLGEAGAPPWGELRVRPIPLWKPTQLQPFLGVAAQGGEMVATLPFNQRFTVWIDLEAAAGQELQFATDTYLIGTEPTVRASYITRDGRQQFETFGWMSGHELHLSVPPGVHILALKYRPHSYDSEVLGTFRSSDPFLVTLWDKAVRTLAIDMADSWMDCPDRERAPWPGDATIALGQAPYVFDARASLLSRKTLAELIHWRRADGILYGPVPSGNWNRELPLQSLAAIGPYGLLAYFNDTGDETLLREAYPSVKGYLLDTWQMDAQGLVIHRAGDWDWGDWGDNQDLPLLDNTWYLLALDAASRMASQLGQTQDLPGYQSRIAAIRGAFNAAFWDGHAYRSPGHAGPPDERGNALAVLCGLSGPDQASDLLTVLTQTQNASPYMEKYVLEALCRLGRADLALARIRQRYGAMVASDNTTLFEVFPADGTPDHAWSGGVLTVLAQEVVGLRPTSPGWSTFEVMPQTGGLDWIALDTPTRLGLIRVEVRTTPAGQSMILRVPPRTSALAGLPVYGVGDLLTLNGVPVDETLPPTSRFHRIQLPPGTWELGVVRAFRPQVRGDSIRFGEAVFEARQVFPFPPIRTSRILSPGSQR